MTILMITAIEKATQKFGEVLAIRVKGNDTALLMIERDNPVFSDRPYMIITYGENGGFFTGHYDLSKHQAIDSFNG